MKYTMIIFLIVIKLIGIHCCTALRVLDGETAELYFSYPCDTYITLQHQHKDTSLVYHSKGLVQSKRHNYLVSEQTSAAQDPVQDKCSLYLVIDPVTIYDEGIYVLTAYNNDNVITDVRRVRLQVKENLRKASCEPRRRYHKEWVKLHCSASSRSSLGQIVCYQGGQRAPPLTEPQYNGRALVQMMLATLLDPVYCCVSPLEETKDKCECIDWVWDPINNRTVHGVTLYTCPPKLQSTDPTVIHEHSSSNIHDVPRSKDITLAKTSDGLVIHSDTVIIGLVCLSVFVICTYLCVYGIVRKDPDSKDIFSSV